MVAFTRRPVHSIWVGLVVHGGLLDGSLAGGDFVGDQTAEEFADVLALVETEPPEGPPGVVDDVDPRGLLLEGGPPVACAPHSHLSHPRTDPGPVLRAFDAAIEIGHTQKITTGVHRPPGRQRTTGPRDRSQRAVTR